jgi:hypothetical protein
MHDACNHRARTCLRRCSRSKDTGRPILLVANNSTTYLTTQDYMASVIKTYFLAPSWDLRPTDLVLGSVVANFKDPSRALFVPSPPHSIGSKISSPAPSKDVKGIVKQSGAWSAGFFATFVRIITFGAAANASSNSSTDITFTCEKMESRWFTPSSDYVQQASENRAVAQYLNICGPKTSVFMITGVKIVRGARITTVDDSGLGLQAHLGVEIPAAETTIGPKASKKKKELVRVARDVPGPVVFAYEVDRIWRNNQGDAESARHTKGAMLGVTEMAMESGIMSAACDLTADEAKSFGVSVATTVDDMDGSSCMMVVPRA